METFLFGLVQESRSRVNSGGLGVEGDGGGTAQLLYPRVTPATGTSVEPNLDDHFPLAVLAHTGPAVPSSS